MTKDLTQYATEAYTTKLVTGFTHNPHIESSPAWYAHELAIYFANTGRTKPYDVKMPRGYSIRANDMLFKIHHDEQTINFERIN